MFSLSCNSTTQKDISNETIKNNENKIGHLTVTKDTNRTIIKDTCIKITSKDKFDCLSAFSRSYESCERGYSSKDSLNYFFKKIYLKSIDKMYLFALFEKSNMSRIYELKDGKWFQFHSLPDSLFFFFPNVCQCTDDTDISVPTIKFVDLNGDKIPDIRIIAYLNMNGNEYSYLYLTDTVKKSLTYIDYMFSNPEFDYKINRLKEVENTSVTRNGFHATYKCEGTLIYPDLMLEDDKSEIDWQQTPLRGLKFNIYHGNGLLGKRSTNWTLLQSYKEPVDSIYSKWYKIIGENY
jgi:hypothetical protein